MASPRQAGPVQRVTSIPDVSEHLPPGVMATLAEGQDVSDDLAAQLFPDLSPGQERELRSAGFPQDENPSAHSEAAEDIEDQEAEVAAFTLADLRLWEMSVPWDLLGIGDPDALWRDSDETAHRLQQAGYKDESKTLFIGRDFSAAQFLDWWSVQGLGTIPANALGLHHTAIPNEYQWIGPQHIVNIFGYYRNTLGWPYGVGPHFWSSDGQSSYRRGEYRMGIGTHPAFNGIGISYRNNLLFHWEQAGFYDSRYPSARMIAGNKVCMAAICGRRKIPVRIWAPGWDGPKDPQQTGVLPHRMANTDRKTCYGAAVGTKYVNADLQPDAGQPEPEPEKPHPGKHVVGVYNAVAHGGEVDDVAAAFVEAVHSTLPENQRGKVARWTGQKDKVNFASLSSYDSPAEDKVWCVVIGRGAAQHLDQRAVREKLLEKDDRGFEDTGHQNCVDVDRAATIKLAREALAALARKERLDQGKVLAFFDSRFEGESPAPDPEEPEPGSPPEDEDECLPTYEAPGDFDVRAKQAITRAGEVEGVYLPKA